MDDVWGDFLGPPHGTTPAAVIANKTYYKIAEIAADLAYDMFSLFSCLIVYMYFGFFFLFLFFAREFLSVCAII